MMSLPTDPLSISSQSCLIIDISSANLHQALKLIDHSLTEDQRIPSNLTFFMNGFIPFDLAWTYSQSEGSKTGLDGRILTVIYFKFMYKLTFLNKIKIIIINSQNFFM